MARASDAVAMLAHVDPSFALPREGVDEVGRELWRATNGGYYGVWSDFAVARGIAAPEAEALWRSFAAFHSGADGLIEALARQGGWEPGPGGPSSWDAVRSRDAIDYALYHAVSPPRVKTGVRALDEALGGGWAAGTYTAIGGEGGTGKTALAVQAAYAAAAGGTFMPIVYSLEIPVGECWDRLLSVHSHLTPGLEQVWWSTARSKSKAGSQWELWQMDEREQLGAARRYEREHACDDPVIAAWRDLGSRLGDRIAVRGEVTGVSEISDELQELSRDGYRVMPIIDHMHLLEPPDGVRADGEYERMTAVSHELMRLCRRLRIPMVALAELRNVGQSERANPRLTWFRGSGHVGYDSGCALILARGDGDDGREADRPVEAHVVKNRHGRSGQTVRLSFNGGMNWFE